MREIAHRVGKQVRLDLRGGETELDKVLVEQLDDPFLHSFCTGGRGQGRPLV